MKELGFMELDFRHLERVNGGGVAGPPIGSYVSSDSIARANQVVREAITDAWDYIRGFGKGFFNL